MAMVAMMNLLCFSSLAPLHSLALAQLISLTPVGDGDPDLYVSTVTTRPSYASCNGASARCFLSENYGADSEILAPPTTVVYIGVLAWYAGRHTITASLVCGTAPAQLPRAFALQADDGSTWSSATGGDDAIRALGVASTAGTKALALVVDSPPDLFGAALNSAPQSIVRICHATVDNTTGALVADAQRCACRDNFTASTVFFSNGAAVPLHWRPYRGNADGFAWTLVSAATAVSAGVVPNIGTAPNATARAAATYFVASLVANASLHLFAQAPSAFATSPALSAAVGWTYSPRTRFAVLEATPQGGIVGACSPGFYQPHANATCVACAPGTASPYNSSFPSACFACAPGTFSAQAGAAACSACAVNRAVSYTGATACQSCIAGWTTGGIAGASFCTPNCTAFSSPGNIASCAVCSALPGCGFCAATGTCYGGDWNGPANATCAAASWAFYPAQCTSGAQAQCNSATSCSQCTARSSCGWCGASGKCLAGSSAGPSLSATATCAASAWAWVSSSCAATGPTDQTCAQHTQCGQCSSYAGCGWCVSAGADGQDTSVCTAGDSCVPNSFGPSVRECDAWEFTADSCSATPPFTPLPSATVTLRLATTLVQAATAEFQSAFIAATASALNVSAQQVTIVNIYAGSVLIDVRITADPTASGVARSSFNATNVALALVAQAANPQSPLVQAAPWVDTSFGAIVASVAGVYQCADGSVQTDNLMCCVAGQALQAANGNGQYCSACAPGTFRSVAMPLGACQPCGAGEYSRRAGAAACEVCAGGEVQENGAKCKMPLSTAQLVGIAFAVCVCVSVLVGGVLASKWRRQRAHCFARGALCERWAGTEAERAAAAAPEDRVVELNMVMPHIVAAPHFGGGNGGVGDELATLPPQLASLAPVRLYAPGGAEQAHGDVHGDDEDDDEDEFTDVEIGTGGGYGRAGGAAGGGARVIVGADGYMSPRRADNEGVSVFAHAPIPSPRRHVQLPVPSNNVLYRFQAPSAPVSSSSSSSSVVSPRLPAPLSSASAPVPSLVQRAVVEMPPSPSAEYAAEVAAESATAGGGNGDDAPPPPYDGGAAGGVSAGSLFAPSQYRQFE